jgi:hypothetical protein
MCLPSHGPKFLVIDLFVALLKEKKTGDVISLLLLRQECQDHRNSCVFLSSALALSS